MSPKTLFDYIDGLTDEQLEAYAARCGTTANYMKGHVKFATRTPKNKKDGLLRKLSEESEGCVTHEEVLMHFGFLDRPEGQESQQASATA